MQCPHCRFEVDATSWFCPQCAEQLVDAPEVPEADGHDGAESTLVQFAETTVWDPDGSASAAEALIVGKLDDEMDVVSGVVTDPEGRTRSYRLYAPRSPVDDGAVSVHEGVGVDFSLTPYEAAVLEHSRRVDSFVELIDDLQLTPEEGRATLLTLQERGLIEFSPRRDSSRLQQEPELPDLGSDPDLDLDGSSSRLTGGPTRVDPPPDPSERKVLGSGLSGTPSGPFPAAEVSPPSGSPGPHEPPGPSLLREKVPTAAFLAQPQTQAEPERLGADPHPLARPRPEQAEALLQAALQDRQAGNLVSARMNLKLAAAFQPDRETIRRLFDELAREGEAPPPTPRHAAASALYAKATDAEDRGGIDEAIGLLERALKADRDPVILNRLGVLLATRKRDLARAQTLLEEAVQEAPQNPAYMHNLSKVLVRTVDVDAPREPKGSFWGRVFGRRRR